MSDAPALVLLHCGGGLYRVRTPVPSLTVLSLQALASAVLHEWIVPLEDGHHISVCGHTFRAVGWLSTEPPGVVLDHDDCDCS